MKRIIDIQDTYFNIGASCPKVDADLEEIKSEICDNYCRYPREYADQEEMIDTVCVTCPLLRLEDCNELQVRKSDESK